MHFPSKSIWSSLVASWCKQTSHFQMFMKIVVDNLSLLVDESGDVVEVSLLHREKVCSEAKLHLQCQHPPPEPANITRSAIFKKCGKNFSLVKYFLSNSQDVKNLLRTRALLSSSVSGFFTLSPPIVTPCRYTIFIWFHPLEFVISLYTLHSSCWDIYLLSNI